MKVRNSFLLVPFFLAGCGPSVHGLVQAKHYREAVCAAHDGTSDDQDVVARALDKDADIYVHVHTVSETELQPILGLDTPAAMERGRIMLILDSVSKEPVSLQIDARYISMRQTGKSKEDRCVVPRSATLLLGKPQEIEKTTQERFGDRMQPVRALIRSK